MTLKNLKKIISLFFAIAFLFNCTNTAFATEKCEQTAAPKVPLQTEWPASPLTQKTLSETTTIAQLVQYAFEWGVGLGGLAVFISLIIAGVEYITSIADPGKLKDAKDRIKSSLIGLVLLLSSWAIFNLINPNLNTLQDITDIGSAILDGGFATNKACNNNWECCEIPKCNPATDCAALPEGANDPKCCAGLSCNPAKDCADLVGGANDPKCCVDLNCAPENYACCQRNDTNCIQGKAPRSTIIGGGGIHVVPNCVGDVNACKKCIGDGACAENYCYCDRNTSPWKQYCKANPKICINILGTPILGCDFIAFYPAENHPEASAIYYSVGKTADSNWIHPKGNTLNADGSIKTTDVPVGVIKSYQAFRAARNQKTEYITETGAVTTDINKAKKVLCGKNSCGCKLDACDDPDATNSRCVNPLGLDLAFNTNLDGEHEVVQIKDDTKTNFAKVLNWWDRNKPW